MVGESEFQMAALKDIPWGTNLAVLTAEWMGHSKADLMVARRAAMLAV